MKTTVHIISHSHWDREWYQSFESHRMKLIELVDNILDKAENDPEFGGFFLDGQVIAIDDYLEIRPEKRAQVEKCIREGKLQTGPWYILQDEFLTSGEACVRNLQVGMQEAKQYGAIGNVGYFPDAFGNAGQMPQVLKQAGMDAVVFGRGVKPIGPNNEVTGGQYESTYSEMMWASPDGTKLPGILFANWYNNGVEIPVDEAEAKETAKIVGLAALKYGDLSNQAAKDYVFDIDRFISFEGNTGPYILYTIVRIKSILAKYEAQNPGAKAETILPAASDAEKALMLELYKYNDVMENAFAETAPHKICQYIFDLSNAFNSFYHDTRILAEEDKERQAGWIALITLVKRVLEACIQVLGLEAPERM